MKAAIIILVFLVEGFSFLLHFLNYTNKDAKLPDSVKDVYDSETYKKRSAYDMEKLRVNIISGVCLLAFNSLLLIFNSYSALFDYAAKYTANLYLQSIFMCGVVLLAAGIIEKVFSTYVTFSIEARYGFNKTTVKTFVRDSIISAVFSAVLEGGLLIGLVYVFTVYERWALLILFVALSAITVIVVFVYHFFTKLYNKYTPLEEGALKDRISKLAGEAGFSVNRILIMNASKRSTKLNASFSGMGKAKKIVLYDTLLEKMNEDEIVAVLAHEIGHAKLKHLVRSLPFTFLLVAILVLLMQVIVGWDAISLAFGFTGLNIAFSVYVCYFVFSPISIILRIPSNYISRAHEYAADGFAARVAGKQNIISALKKLARENYANLTPHPFVVLLKYTHPPLADRIRHIESCE